MTNTISQFSYGYDGAGNRTWVKRANGNLETDGSGWNYDYDSDNKLRWASSSTLSVDYIYDAFGRLSVSSSSAGVTRRYYYDDQWRVIAEDDGTGTLTAKYVYGPEIDEPVRLTRNGNRYFYHQAALGTVTELTGFLGYLRESYTYDVYGEPTLRNNVGTVITTSQFGNRFLFQGRDRDPDTGLYNFRNRWYSPTLGRFLQMDPIREEGGLNLYQFAEANPVVFRDPYGLCIWYGQWGGPNWTGGYKGTWEEVVDNGITPRLPDDNQDICYMVHDKCYAKCRDDFRNSQPSKWQSSKITLGKCLRSCDRDLSQCLRNLPCNDPSKDTKACAAGALFGIRGIIGHIAPGNPPPRSKHGM